MNQTLSLEKFYHQNIGTYGRGAPRRRWSRALLGIVTLVSAVLGSRAALAVEAEPGLQPFPLDATGATFDAEQIGDELFNYIKTPEGIIVVFNPSSGQYEVAALGQDPTGANTLVPSGTALSDLTPYGGRVDPSYITPIDDESLELIWLEAEARSQALSQLPVLANPTLTSTTSRPLLTVMVEFTPDPTMPSTWDGSFRTGYSYWDQTIYGNAPGSVNHYYNDMSRDKFSFVRVSETQGIANDGIVKVRLPYPHPNCRNDWAGSCLNMIKDALSAANPYVDFAAFDTDGDGTVERSELNLLFVVAGYETSNNATATPSFWAHALGFGGDPIVDGKKVEAYASVGEVHKHVVGGVLTEVPATLGVVVHELGHTALGLPDLYKGPSPIGVWCVMGSGSWGKKTGDMSGSTPTAMSAWSRVKAGFLSPLVIAQGAAAQNIGVVQSAGTTFLGLEVDPNIYKVETSDPQQYFLIENRENDGYDEGLQKSISFASAPGGLAIYRIDEDKSASEGKIIIMANIPTYVNNISSLYNQESGKTFTPLTDPSSDDAHGQFTGLSVTDISAAGPIMVANVSFTPFACNAITAKVSEHEVHGRAFKLLADNIFYGYKATGTTQHLGFDKNAIVTLHVEAPGMWSTGPCP